MAEYVCKEGHYFEHNLSNRTTIQCVVDSDDPLNALWDTPEGFGSCIGKHTNDIR